MIISLAYYTLYLQDKFSFKKIRNLLIAIVFPPNVFSFLLCKGSVSSVHLLEFLIMVVVCGLLVVWSLAVVGWWFWENEKWASRRNQKPFSSYCWTVNEWKQDKQTTMCTLHYVNWICSRNRWIFYELHNSKESCEIYLHNLSIFTKTYICVFLTPNKTDIQVKQLKRVASF